MAREQVDVMTVGKASEARQAKQWIRIVCRQIESRAEGSKMCG
jgi:hypothetical protein